MKSIKALCRVSGVTTAITMMGRIEKKKGGKSPEETGENPDFPFWFL